MKRIAFSALTLGSLLFLSLSCGKKSSPAPNCKLITITDVSGATNITANIAYNNDGNISTIQETGTNPSSKVFTYIGNLVMVATTASSGNETDSLVLNSSGLM